MKRFRYPLLLAFIAALAAIVLARRIIAPERASRAVGRVETTCGLVADAHFAAGSNGQPTFLDIGKPYPRQVLTVIIWGSDRGNFKEPPETLYAGKRICVTGVMQSYRGRPEIIVRRPSQIKADR